MAKAIAPLVKLNNGLEIPVLGLGTWKSPAGQVCEAVKIAILEAGYRHIDCAFIYGNEDEVGKALDEVFKTGLVKREELFITSKIWNTFHSRERVIECAKKSLEKLGLTYLDLCLIHWPLGFKEGDDLFPKDASDKMLYSDVDYTETWKGMEDLLKSGLTKSIGLSNFNEKQITRVLEVAEVKPAMNQIESHPYLTNTKLIEFCRSKDIMVTGYSPLGSPDWAKPGEPSLLDHPKILEIAETHKVTPAQVLIKFQLQRGLIVIPKSVTRERIISNIQVFGFELSSDEMKLIESFNCDHHFVGLEELNDHKHYPF